MTQLRTDLPSMSDEEMDLWVNEIMKYTNYHDIENLYKKLDDAIRSHNQISTGNRKKSSRPS
jgi:predicted metal-dependent peptidase